MCFTVDKQTVLVIFNKGKNYSQCPYDASGTTLSLTFGPGLDWEYFSNKSDATLQVLDIEPSTFDGCLVCQVYMYTCTYTHELVLI